MKYIIVYKINMKKIIKIYFYILNLINKNKFYILNYFIILKKLKIFIN